MHIKILLATGNTFNRDQKLTKTFSATLFKLNFKKAFFAIHLKYGNIIDP